MNIEIHFTPSFVDIHIFDENRSLFHAAGIQHNSYTLENRPDLDGKDIEFLKINFSGSLVLFPLTPELVHSFHKQHEAFGNSLTDAWIDSLGVLND